MVQWILVIVIVAAAAVYLGRRLWPGSTPGDCACGEACGSCPASSDSGETVACRPSQAGPPAPAGSHDRAP